MRSELISHRTITRVVKLTNLRFYKASRFECPTLVQSRKPTSTTPYLLFRSCWRGSISIKIQINALCKEVIHIILSLQDLDRIWNFGVLKLHFSSIAFSISCGFRATVLGGAPFFRMHIPSTSSAKQRSQLPGNYQAILRFLGVCSSHRASELNTREAPGQGSPFMSGISPVRPGCADLLYTDGSKGNFGALERA